LIFKGHTEITEITEMAARGVFLCPAEMAEITEIFICSANIGRRSLSVISVISV
jgi:hypothetical protein